jgi:predicted RNA polymerase sigma factor
VNQLVALFDDQLDAAELVTVVETRNWPARRPWRRCIAGERVRLKDVDDLNLTDTTLIREAGFHAFDRFASLQQVIS